MTGEEKTRQAKLPGAETGIEIRHTMCDICTPGPQCGVDAYVKDGVVIKMEGTDGFPGSNGKLCVKGAAGRQYLYRADRIQTPMKRTGPRGGGRFTPISWDEALDTCAAKLAGLRDIDPDSVVWLTGYSKWYRPFLHRLAHSFGTENYLTESSACHQAEVMSYLATFGQLMNVSPKKAKTVICWGVNSLANAFPLGRTLTDIHEKGGTIVVIDPRVTHSAQHLADIYLRPKNGTDGALAHAMARHIIRNGWQNQAFIDRYVHGFPEYRAYIQNFTPERAEAASGVPAAEIERVAELLAHDPTAVIMPSNALTHRVNGFNTHRAILSLMVILGRVDRPGGLMPVNESFCHSDGGFVSLERQFIDETRPARCKSAVGKQRFPLWADMVDEGQGMDLIRQLESGDPYKIRALACFGVNDRMYPESPRLLAAMDRLDFSFATDIFWTDVCRHADIVLPVCTSYERGEVKCYGGRFVNFTRPAVPPLYDSRPDTDIICELSRRMGLGDTLLESGYDACVEYIFSPAGITDWEAVKDAPLPVPVPTAARYAPGAYLRHIPTPSGRIELYSEAAAKYRALGLKPLPEYIPAPADPDYPFTLMSGARLPHTIHSRGHEVPWLRALRPDPMGDICAEDARTLGLAQGDDMVIETAAGRLVVKANITETARPGEVLMVHGYREANVNALIPLDYLDPHTGFPGYKQIPCAVRKAAVNDGI